jgi:hypothetical protein
VSASDTNGVVITLRDVYTIVVGLTAKVDASLARTDRVDELRQAAETNAEKQHVDHEARLRALERNRWPLASLQILIALGAAIVAAVALLTK